MLDVSIPRKSLDRALRILDALLKSLDVRGYVVSCTTEGQRRTTARVLDEDISFCLEEETVE